MRRLGFFKSFKFDIRLRIRLRYLTPVSFNSLKIAEQRKTKLRIIFEIKYFLPSSTRAANSTGSADPSGSSDIEKAFAIRSRDFNLK